MNRKGFTLIEMIVVIVLIGVIIVVAVPNVIKIMKNQEEDKYDSHLKLVAQAANLYTIINKGEFDNQSEHNTFIIEYSKLLEEKLLVEQDFTCTGTIKADRIKRNNFKFTIDLTCDGKQLKTYESNGQM